MPWEETENEIRHRLYEPSLFEKDSFRRITLKEDKPRVFAIIGKLKGEDKTTLQAIRFPKEDGWTISKAKTWWKEHGSEHDKGAIIIMEKQYQQTGLLCDVKAAPSPTDMQLINAMALSPQEEGAVYVRRFLACHNLVDRTGDRFTEKALDEMAATLHGKSFFVKGHPQWGEMGPGHGRIFKTETAEMSVKKFNEMTGENEKLPKGVSGVKVVWAHVYMLREFNAEIIANIEAGIYTFVSVGFNAKRNAVEAEGNVIQYYELDSPCEGMELSLVWLGAQQGAIAKDYKPQSKKDMDTMLDEMEEHCKEMEKSMGEMKKHCDAAMALCEKMKSEMEGMDDSEKGQAVPPTAVPCEPQPEQSKTIQGKILNIRR